MGKLIPRIRKTYEVKRIVHEIYYINEVISPDEARKIVSEQGNPASVIIKSETVRRVK